VAQPRFCPQPDENDSLIFIITSSGLKMERKNTSKCLGGPRMEDQGLQNAQNFLAKNFLSFNCRENDRSVFK